MNRNSAAGPQARIGLIETPGLGELLEELGCQVITGSDFRSAATTIRTAIKDSGNFPLVVGDAPAPGLGAYIDRIAHTYSVPVIILRNQHSTSLNSRFGVDLQTPCTIDDILEAAGMDPLGGADGAMAYPIGAEVAVEEGEEEDWDTWPADNPETTNTTQLQQASEPADPRADDDEVEDAGYLPPARQQHQADQDDWDTPAPVPQAGARSYPEEPQIQDAQEDHWDTPVSEPPAAHRDEQWNSAPEPAPPTARQRPQGQWAAPVAHPAADNWDDSPAAESMPASSARQDMDDWDSQPPQRQSSRRQPEPAEDFDRWEQPASQPEDRPVPAQSAQGWDDDSWNTPAPLHPASQPQTGWNTPEPAPGGGNWGDEEWGTPAAPAQTTHQPAPRQSVPRQAPAVRDASEIFDSAEAMALAGTGRNFNGLGTLVIDFSGKGGVGKSTTTINIARVAAKHGLRVIVIDGNSGQGDLRTYLRLNQTDLPTIYDAATTGDPSRAILSPAMMNKHRNPNLGAIEFAFVAAPPDELNDTSIVTNAVYAKMIDFARRNADLVVLDTQIMESADKTGVVGSIILPALVGDAWGIGIADMSNTGVNNLKARMRMLKREGATSDRFMVLFNRVEMDEIETADRASKLFYDEGTFLGSITVDPAIKDAMNAGRIDPGSEPLEKAMATALYRITGNEEFREVAERELVAAGGKKRIGFFSRLFGKKGG